MKIKMELELDSTKPEHLWLYKAIGDVLLIEAPEGEEPEGEEPEGEEPEGEEPEGEEPEGEEPEGEEPEGEAYTLDYIKLGVAKKKGFGNNRDLMKEKLKELGATGVLTLAEEHYEAFGIFVDELPEA